MNSPRDKPGVDWAGSGNATIPMSVREAAATAPDQSHREEKTRTMHPHGEILARQRTGKYQAPCAEGECEGS